MDRTAEGLEGALERARRQSIERLVLDGPSLHVVNDVPVPGTHARGLQRQPIALLTCAQGGLGLLAGDELFFRRQPRPMPANTLLERVFQVGPLRDLQPG